MLVPVRFSGSLFWNSIVVTLLNILDLSESLGARKCFHHFFYSGHASPHKLVGVATWFINCSRITFSQLCPITHIQKWKNAVISEDFSYNHFTTLHTSFKSSEETTVKVDFAFRGILEFWALNSASCRRQWVCSALYKEPPFSDCGSKKTNLEHLASLRAPFSCLLFNGKNRL